MPHMNTSGITRWTPDELPDLSGKRMIITGGNSGIGFEAAKILASKNADVVIGVRNLEKGRQALAKLVNIGSGRAQMLPIDLADSASIRAAVDEAKERFDVISALINNAGVMQTPKGRTKDGFETQLGTNHLGHFLWTKLMIDRVDPWEGRVVTVASIAHKFARIDFDNLLMERGYDASRSYLRSKLANLLFAMELHRRLEFAGSRIKSIACHPGYSATPLLNKTQNPFSRLANTASSLLFAQSQVRGSWPTTLAAGDDRAVSGGYYGPTGFFDARGPVGDCDVDARALDAGVAERLWEVSEGLVGEELIV